MLGLGGQAACRNAPRCLSSNARLETKQTTSRVGNRSTLVFPFLTSASLRLQESDTPPICYGLRWLQMRQPHAPLNPLHHQSIPFYEPLNARAVSHILVERHACTAR
ncbi:hypothetical protein WJX84_010519 [Apatococcus fuscideae]|uniref:Uncharacterized protein n=1 Tax=Apatococcus fuscideae TaxID=2026836 RepID=A0AAW1T6S7_9CHLO